jgi:hypothetical protein
MSASMAKVCGRLGNGPGVLARQLALNFDRSRNAGNGNGGSSTTQPVQQRRCWMRLIFQDV